MVRDHSERWALINIALSIILLATIVSGASSIALGAESGTQTPDTGAEDDVSVIEEVDEQLRVLSFEFIEGEDRPNRFRIKLSNRGDEISTATITEALSARSSEGRIGIEVYRIDAGETVTVELQAFTDDPIGAVITTSRSAEDGHATFLEREDDSDSRLIGGAPTGGDVRAAGAFGIFGSLFLVGLGAWHRASRENTEMDEVDVGGSG